MSNSEQILPHIYDQWVLKHSDFTCIDKIGSGISANVFYGKDNRKGHEGEEIAIKKLKFKSLNDQKLQAFQREVSILAATAHPCILNFVGVTKEPPFCIVTEWMPGETLYHDIHVNNKLNPTKKTICAFDIARGMLFLHSKHIIHRDLKSLNILLNKDGLAKICDFGLSRAAKEGELYTQNVGTPHWMAPELLSSSRNYTEKVDVYAFGIVLWELVSGQIPYEGLNAPQIVTQVMINDLRPDIPSDVDQAMRDLITKCWAKEPSIRPSFEEIVRLFQTGEIYISGTDKEEFLKYVNETSEPIICNEQCVINDDDVRMKSLVETLEKDGIPDGYINEFWNTFENNPGALPQTKGKIAAYFLLTPLCEKAADLIRSLPVQSVPPNLIVDAIEKMPTDSPKFDDDLCVIACKNGAADAVAVYAQKAKYVKLALELISQQGVSPALRAAVADKSVQCLSNSDPAMICAAVRCLIGIGELKRISPSILSQLLNSENIAVKNCGVLASAAVLESGFSLSDDVIDLLISCIDKCKFVTETIALACQNELNAAFIIHEIDRISEVNTESAITALLNASKHLDLRPSIVLELDKLSQKDNTSNVNLALQKLQNYIV